MSLPLYLVDAFTDQAFAGNPATVCFYEGDLDDRWMQSLGMEMNQAETAFVRPNGDAFDLRWFTPNVEVDLCGHATLASAHALWTTGRHPLDQAIRFNTRSGVLVATNATDGIQLDFPALSVEKTERTAEFEAIFGGTLVAVGKTSMDWFVELASEHDVRAFEPDFPQIASLGLRGLIITARGEATDFVSRFFAPQSGVPEDAVTGSAHCALATFWAEGLGKSQMLGFQASKRGGHVRVELVGDRVMLVGHAVTVLSGEVLVDGD